MTDYLLEDGEYYKEVIPKTMIFIHSTSGSSNPKFSVDGWAHDRNKSGGQLPVATAYIIGGKSTTNGDTTYDGKVYRTFDDSYWAHHLGLDTLNNKLLNQKSIGIEICSYGPLTKTKDGTFLNYVNKPVPADMVAELATPYRGFTHYQKYTQAQLATLKTLLLDIAQRHNIDLKVGLQQKVFSSPESWLEVKSEALQGYPGLWSHSSVRKDKFDVYPDAGLVELIKSL